MIPACLPGRTHISTVTDIGAPFAPRVRAYCSVCRQTFEYDTQTMEQMMKSFKRLTRRPERPETWNVVETPAHVRQTNVGKRGVY